MLSYYPSGQIKELIKGNGYKARYIYDGLGRRILKIYEDSTGENVYTLEYIHRGLSDRVLYTRSKWINGSRATLFADGSGMDEHLFEIDSTSGAEVYQTDYLGSVLSPDLNSKEGYGLFGEVVGSISPVGNYRTLEYGYSGREYEADTGLYYFRARYYDPEMGRFLTKDPIGLAGGHTNLYLYCGNDPVNCTDPTGMIDPATAAVLIGGGIGAVAGGTSAYLAGGDTSQIATAVAIGAAAGAGSVIAGASGIVAAIAGGGAVGFVSDFANQTLVGGSSLSELNYTSIAASTAVGAISGGVGGIAGTRAFFNTPVIGNPVGVGSAITAGHISGAIVGGGIGGVGTVGTGLMCQ